MSLSNGQKSALYLLLTSRSELRLMLEGKFTVDGSGVVTPAEGANTQPVANATVAVTRFLSLVKFRFGLAPAQFNLGALAGLYKAGATDPNGNATNITTSGPDIRRALDMSAPYPDGDPCPDLYTQSLVYDAVVGAVPAVSVAQLELQLEDEQS